MKNQLTKNFCLDELTRSATAIRYGICNEPPVEVISNLQNLCQEVLQPLRDHLGVPVVITSGYRCRLLNRLVGGVPNSQHIAGEAADIIVPGAGSKVDLPLMREAFAWIGKNCVFDQLIWEQGKGGSVWIHVSCKRRLGENRRLKVTQIPQISQIWEDLRTDVSDGLTALSPCEQVPRFKPLISSAPLCRGKQIFVEYRSRRDSG